MVIEEVPGIRVLPEDLIHRSKITIPPVAGISRPRLVERIEQGARGKLTVVSAPAGWGKSTLLAEWATRTDMNVAWISLDESDTNPTRYFRSLVAALDHVYPLQLDDVFTMLRSPTPAINDLIDQAILSRLDEVPNHTALVLDDFHVMTNQDQLRSFSRVLERMSPNLHLVIATRGEIQLPLARLRATGEVTILRSGDIAMTVPEAREVLIQLPGPVLDTEDVELLVKRTEGWVAGLRLASISLGHQRDPRGVIERFRGTHRDVADYFREEVLDRLEPDLRQFLVETSGLDRFTEALCNAVTLRNDAHAMLSGASAANLFLIPLDDERNWYRYHGLFRDMLRADFARLPESRKGALNQRASAWFERNGMFTEAVEHALVADDPERAAGLVDRYADSLMFVCGETAMLVDWIERLPEQLLLDRPGLLRVYAWALTTMGRIDQAELVMNRVCDDFHVQGGTIGLAEDRERDGELTAVRARIAAYRGDHRATIVHGKRALDLLDPMRHGRVYGDVMLSIGFAERALGNLDTAADAFADAASLGRIHGNVQAARWGARYLAVTRVSQGRLNEAEAIIDEDLDRVRQDSADPGSMLSALLVGKAEILIERDRLSDARKALDQAIPLIQKVGDAKMLMNAYVAMGTMLLSEDRPTDAREKFRRAEEIFPGAQRGARVAWLALMQGNFAEAGRWARSSGFSVDDDVDWARGEQEQMIFAHITALTEPSEASFGLIERLVEDAEQGGRYGSAIGLRTILAVARQRAGDDAQARLALRKALDAARHEGFARVFVDQGPVMRAMLRDLARDRAALDEPTRVYAMELLTHFTEDGAASPSSLAIDEPLTSRQLEILQLLAAGQSNRDIANHLFIAEGTVKAHMHQLFGKLMARNRTEAVANARELHLLA